MVVMRQKVSLQVITAAMFLNVLFNSLKYLVTRDLVVPYSSLDSDYISCLSSFKENKPK